jgi:hypothetical protein
VELKTDWWKISSQDKPNGFLQDIKKLIKILKSTDQKEYLPQSYFAISLVTFYKSKKKENGKIVDNKKVLDAFEKLEKELKSGFQLFHTHIVDDTYLIGAYHPF